MSHRSTLLTSLLIVLVGTVTLTPSIAQTNTEESGLRKFIERKLSFQGGNTKLMVGKLPDKIPVKLPIPSKSKVLGSTLDDKGNINIIFDVSQPNNKIVDFYKSELKKSGWKQRGDGFFGGFLSKDLEVGGYNLFCKNNPNSISSLTVNIRENRKTTTAVSLYLSTTDKKDKSNPCRPFSPPDYAVSVSYPGTFYNGLLPALKSPSNTEVSEIEGEYIVHNNESAVILKTKLDSNQLTNHYIQQLEKAGWKKIDSGKSNSYNWSTWNFKDDKGKSWHGILSFTAIQGKPHQYFANLRGLKLGE